MKKLGDNQSSFKTKKALGKIISVLGLLCIVAGVFLVVLSLQDEVIDNNFIVKSKAEYRAIEPKKLSDGEYYVTKDTNYTKNGVYKLTYKNYFNDKRFNVLFSPAERIPTFQIPRLVSNSSEQL